MTKLLTNRDKYFKKTVLLSAVLIASLAQAQSDVSIYGGGLNYSKSSKDNGWFSGIYYQNSNSKDKIELDYERTKISYIDIATEDLKQNDFTVAWTHYINSNYLFRLGGHYIDSNDALTDQGYTVFGGLKYFQGYDFDMGIDAYYSDYKNYRYINTTEEGLKVEQLEPSVGFTFSDYSSPVGSFYLKVFYDYINLDAPDNSSLNNDYHSAGLVLKNFKGKWTSEVGGWVGKQIFAVKNNGFTVYNLAEERKGGVHASVNYALTKSTGIKVRYAYERFSEVGYSKASSQALNATISHNF